MKMAFRTLTTILCFMALALSSLAQTQIRSRDVLRNEPDQASRHLADAMDRSSSQEIQNHAITLVKSGKAQLVINCLSDPSDVAKQGLCMALAATKQYQAVPLLTDLYEQMLTTSVRGGDEAQILRSQTVQAVETGLVQLTGMTLDPKLTPSEKLSEFRKRAGGRSHGVPDEARSETAVEPEPSRLQPYSPSKGPAHKPAIEEPASSTSRNIVVVLIVTAAGLFWLRLKRRSQVK